MIDCALCFLETMKEEKLVLHSYQLVREERKKIEVYTMYLALRDNICLRHEVNLQKAGYYTDLVSDLVSNMIQIYYHYEQA